ncbi:MULTISPECIES: hypothetical protein [Mycobacteriaceae]|uniref:hypothetical protein n=1 Tax=Mycobacteriaceae TaxID=1762 RepID=UPI0007FB9B35|nr:MULTISPECIES: hypothetical protein [Mycobacteriaceae]MCK0177518.1 hypothetical protein [Mycolicibacterium sp. F2034L]OBB60593.1 hypothetical protein A5757_08470 [Mycobacterium sp. 852013-51886_SCH5428379]
MTALRQAWLEFVGEETTPTGTATILAVAAAGGYLAPRLARTRLGTAEKTLLVVSAVDLWGGAWSNNTLACARWYERPGQTDGDHLRFAAAHLHPFLLAWMDGGGRARLRWAVANYAYLMAATVLIRRAGRGRRVVGVAVTAGAVALDRVLGPSAAAPWFGPVFHAKLLLGHGAAALWPDAAIRAVRRR